MSSKTLRVANRHRDKYSEVSAIGGRFFLQPLALPQKRILDLRGIERIRPARFRRAIASQIAQELFEAFSVGIYISISPGVALATLAHPWLISSSLSATRNGKNGILELGIGFWEFGFGSLSSLSSLASLLSLKMKVEG